MFAHSLVYLVDDKIVWTLDEFEAPKELVRFSDDRQAHVARRNLLAVLATENGRQ